MVDWRQHMVALECNIAGARKLLALLQPSTFTLLKANIAALQKLVSYM